MDRTSCGSVGVPEDLLTGCRRKLAGFHGPDFLTVFCTLLRGLSSSAKIEVPTGISWDALVSCRANTISQRFLKCCEEIDRANVSFFKGTLTQLARRNVHEGVEAGRAIKTALEVAQRLDSPQFGCEEWRDIAQSLSLKYYDEEFSPLGSKILRVLGEVIPNGDCLILAGVRSNIRELNTLRAGRGSDVQMFVRDLSESFLSQAVSRLLIYMSSSDQALAYAPCEGKRFSSAIVSFPHKPGSRRKIDEIVAQLSNLRSIYNELEEEGTLFALVRDGLLFGDGEEEEFRRDIIANDSLEALVLLPGQRGPRTAVARSLLVLSKNKDRLCKGYVRFVDASKLAYSSPDSDDRNAKSEVGAEKLVWALTAPDRAAFKDSEWNLLVETAQIASESSCSWDLDTYRAKLNDQPRFHAHPDLELLRKVEQRDELTQKLMRLLASFRVP